MLVASRLLLVSISSETDNGPSSGLVSCMKLLDLGIMMGGPRTQQLLHSAVVEIEQLVTPRLRDGKRAAKRQRGECERRELTTTARPAQGCQLTLPPRMMCASVAEIQRISLPPLEVFLQQHMKSRRPVILTKAMSDWPAMTPISPSKRDAKESSDGVQMSCRNGRWCDMQYLKRVAGMRTVPVEIGDTYLSKNWRQEMMMFGEFISRHIETKQSQYQQSMTLHTKLGHESRKQQNEPKQEQQPRQDRADKAYLAQHPLFEQIPRLRDDIVTPPYCYLTERFDGGDVEPTVNGWFGKKSIDV